MEEHMHRLATCFNALFLGVILGMIFLAIFQQPSTGNHDTVRHDGSALRQLVVNHIDRRLMR